MEAGSVRGGALLAAGQQFGVKPGVFARLLTPHLSRLLDRIDAGLATGALHGTLPDGTRRTLGGRAPGFTCEVTLHDWRGLLRVATGGSVGLYQAWEAGEWSSPDPVQLFALFMANATSLGDAARAKGPWRWAGRALHFLKRNTRAGAEKNIHAHYDLGNDFYAAWLDPTMTYSSAYRIGDDGLQAAQRRKWARLAERIGAAPSVLEIGCGWGALAEMAAAGFGASVTGVTLSTEQLAFAQQRTAGLPVDLRLQDYRDISDAPFDAICSIEMVEAVGREYWPTYFRSVSRLLKPGGRACVQSIVIDDALFDRYIDSTDFIQQYIFPGGCLPCPREFKREAEAAGLEVVDAFAFGADYAETLRRWRESFLTQRSHILQLGFDERFMRIWEFYLAYCEAAFAQANIDVVQYTLRKR